jgi:hypothetical protein
MLHIVLAVELQAMNFGAQFWVRKPFSGGGHRSQSGTCATMAMGRVLRDFFSHRYFVSLQRAVGFVRIVCA